MPRGNNYRETEQNAEPWLKAYWAKISYQTSPSGVAKCRIGKVNWNA